jgi:signal transduction histidine kinase
VLNNISALLARLVKNQRLYSRFSGADKRNFVEILESIAAGTNTISEFIDLTSNVTPTKEWFDINQIVERATRLLEQRIRGSDVKLKMDLDQDLPDVKVNYFQMMEILLNLISNSLKAMQTVSNRELMVKTGLSLNELGVLVSISDTGIGIQTDHKNLIFHKKHSWWPDSVIGTSSGIGLLNCRQIIEDEYGGEISFESRYGHGTTFHVLIPI